MAENASRQLGVGDLLGRGFFGVVLVGVDPAVEQPLPENHGEDGPDDDGDVVVQRYDEVVAAPPPMAPRKRSEVWHSRGQERRKFTRGQRAGRVSDVLCRTRARAAGGGSGTRTR